ncbi:hypothetical protein ACQKM9_04770 [Viridibacillus sp. NPDC093762]|uniref:hypothetical protein n=1 Tax=Viridibacillus sp. NPDC093762 TaxID=3390720 RepID=UPI003D040748
MNYIEELNTILNINNIWTIIELLLVTSCISTILFILSKNQNISILSSVPVLFVVSLLHYGMYHFVLYLIALLLQAAIVYSMQHQSESKQIQKDKTTSNMGLVSSNDQ